MTAAVRPADIAKPPHCRPLRHGFGTHLVESGYDIRTVRDLLGHEDASTIRICVHVLNRGGHGVVSPLDRWAPEAFHAEIDRPVGHHALRQGCATDRLRDGGDMHPMQARLGPWDVAMRTACMQVAIRGARGVQSPLRAVRGLPMPVRRGLDLGQVGVAALA